MADFKDVIDDGSVIIPRNFVPAGAAQVAQTADPTPEPVAQVAAPVQQPIASPPTVADPAPAAPATVAAPDTPADPPVIDLTPEMIARGLEVASGGKVKDLDQLRELLEIREKVPTFTAQIEELKTKVDRDPFASPLTKKLNDLVAAGATPDEVSHFMRMQAVDTSKLPALDAVRLAVQAENPTFDAAMVDAFMADRLGLGNAIEGGDLTPSDRVALDVAHRDAVAKINAQKVASEVPANQAQLADQQAKQQALRTAYGTVAATIVDANKALQLADGLVFNLPAEVIPHAQQFLTDTAVAGQWKMDAEGTAAASQMLQSYIYGLYGPQIVDMAVKHATAKAKQEAIQAQAGAPPTPTNRVVPPTQTPAANNPSSADFRRNLII